MRNNRWNSIVETLFSVTLMIINYKWYLLKYVLHVYSLILISLYRYHIPIKGLETSSTTLRWALLLMARHRDIQRRVRAEIIEHVGLERPPQMSDRAALRYTEAVLCEIHRFASIAGTSVPHRAMRAVKLHGYFFKMQFLWDVKYSKWK